MAQQGKGFGDTPPPPPGQLTPEDQYKPGFLGKHVQTLTGMNVPKPQFLRRKNEQRYNSVKVWSDMQSKLVTAEEYLRETEPVEMDIVDNVVDDSVNTASEVVGKQFSRKYGESAARKEVLAVTVGQVPLVGKVLKKWAGNIAGVDVTEMGDATIEGRKARMTDEMRAGYDQLAVHFKRQEVQAAVNGRPYEPNFLMGIANLRKVTDGFQDFTRRSEDSRLVDRQSLDTSDAGEAYQQALFMQDKDPDKAYKKAAVGRVGKVTMNYDAKKSPTPIA
jgi:hypothetical protein